MADIVINLKTVSDAQSVQQTLSDLTKIEELKKQLESGAQLKFNFVDHAELIKTSEELMKMKEAMDAFKSGMSTFRNEWDAPSDEQGSNRPTNYDIGQFHNRLNALKALHGQKIAMASGLGTSAPDAFMSTPVQEEKRQYDYPIGPIPVTQSYGSDIGPYDPAMYKGAIGPENTGFGKVQYPNAIGPINQGKHQPSIGPTPLALDAEGKAALYEVYERATVSLRAFEAELEKFKALYAASQPGTERSEKLRLTVNSLATSYGNLSEKVQRYEMLMAQDNAATAAQENARKTGVAGKIDQAKATEEAARSQKVLSELTQQQIKDDPAAAKQTHSRTASMRSLRAAMYQLTSQIPGTQQAMTMFYYGLTPVTAGVAALAVAVGGAIKSYREIEALMLATPEWSKAQTATIETVKRMWMDATVAADEYARSLKRVATQAETTAEMIKRSETLRETARTAENKAKEGEKNLVFAKIDASSLTDQQKAHEKLKYEEAERKRLLADQKKDDQAKLKAISDQRALEESQRVAFEKSVPELEKKATASKAEAEKRETDLKKLQEDKAKAIARIQEIDKAHPDFANPEFVKKLKKIAGDGENLNTQWSTLGGFGNNMLRWGLSLTGMPSLVSELQGGPMVGPLQAGNAPSLVKIARERETLENSLGGFTTGILENRGKIVSSKEQAQKDSETVDIAKKKLHDLTQSTKDLTTTYIDLIQKLTIEFNSAKEEFERDAVSARLKISAQFKGTPQSAKDLAEAHLIEKAGHTTELMGREATQQLADMYGAQAQAAFARGDDEGSDEAEAKYRQWKQVRGDFWGPSRPMISKTSRWSEDAPLGTGVPAPGQRVIDMRTQTPHLQRQPQPVLPPFVLTNLNSEIENLSKTATDQIVAVIERTGSYTAGMIKGVNLLLENDKKNKADLEALDRAFGILRSQQAHSRPGT